MNDDRSPVTGWILIATAFTILLITLCGCQNNAPTGPDPRPPAPPDQPPAVEPPPEPEPAGRPHADLEAQILDRMNALRATTGRCKSRLLSTGQVVEARDLWGGPDHPWGPTLDLEADSLLTEAADAYATDIETLAREQGWKAALDFVVQNKHRGTDGSDPFTRVRDAEAPGYRWEAVAENATCYTAPRKEAAAQAVTNWRESPDGHCQAQWAPWWFHAGVAVRGIPEKGQWIAVAVLARPVGGGPGF